jgi:glycosyltransferase involved in cell wall biosynthesis
MKVLLTGFACEPEKGSEPGFTWNWAWYLSPYVQVWVITHLMNKGPIEAYLAAHPNPRLHFEYVFLSPFWTRILKRFYKLRYVQWQREALKKAQALHAEIGFDLTHHISFGTVSSPPLLYRLPVPMVWGPLGGGQTTPAAFWRYFGWSWLNEFQRTIRVRTVRWLPSLRQAARWCALALATNHETQSLLARAGRRRVELFLDSGYPDELIRERSKAATSGDAFRLLWVGKFEKRKCLPLALEALAKIGSAKVTLEVIGTGRCERAWKQLTERLNLSARVRYHGALPWARVQVQFRHADAFIFTSLRDSFGTQVLEAMAAGLPIITLDHQGVRCFVPSGASVKVPVTNPSVTVTALAEAIQKLWKNPDTRAHMSKCAVQYAKSQTWQHRAEVMFDYYRRILYGDISSKYWFGS